MEFLFLPVPRFWILGLFHGSFISWGLRFRVQGFLSYSFFHFSGVVGNCPMSTPPDTGLIRTCGTQVWLPVVGNCEAGLELGRDLGAATCLARCSQFLLLPLRGLLTLYLWSPFPPLGLRVFSAGLGGLRLLSCGGKRLKGEKETYTCRIKTQPISRSEFRVEGGQTPGTVVLPLSEMLAFSTSPILWSFRLCTDPAVSKVGMQQLPFSPVPENRHECHKSVITWCESQSR